MDEELTQNELDLKGYWRAIVRRRGWLVGPLFLLGWLGFAVAHFWPYLYRSDALILVDQQKVPEQYVTPNVVSNLQDRLQSMIQQILSRTRLQRLIEQFNLYPQERAGMPMEDVVEKMRKDIRIDLVQTAPHNEHPGALTAFSISYSAKNARTAQQVTSQLTSLFIEQNVTDRAQQSVGTTTFLENQLEAAHKDLAEQEERLRAYKMRYLGELPEQQQSNVQILSSLEMQLQATSDSLDRAQQQKIYLESMRDQYRGVQKSGRSVGAAGGPEQLSPLAKASVTLKDLRKHLADLEAVYTPQHPDIVKTKQEISKWEGEKKRLEAEKASGQKDEASQSAAAEDDEDRVLIEVKSRLKSTVIEVEARQKELDALRARIGAVQSHLSLTPMREQQLAEVTRAYENSRQQYQDLLQKKLKSELASNLEKHQEGEQFRILDPASLPEKPNEPSRAEIILIGWGAGLVLGLGLTVLRELTDKTLRNEKDVTESTELPVLVRIPVLQTPRETARRQRYRRLELAVVTVLAVISVSTSLYSCLMS
jgi:protein tyrosine kinase modulator